jgi:hypothetical protein
MSFGGKSMKRGKKKGLDVKDIERKRKKNEERRKEKGERRKEKEKEKKVRKKYVKK